MNAAELIENLTQQSVSFVVHDDTFSIRAPKGVVSSEICTLLKRHKLEILALLQKNNSVWQGCEQGESRPLPNVPSLKTLGHLIGGRDGRSPIVDPTAMAQALVVSFRPLPQGYSDEAIQLFRAELQARLAAYGVRIESWEEATKAFSYSLKVPLLNQELALRTKVVKSSINAVIDIERPISIRRTAENWFAEKMYQLHCYLFQKNSQKSIPRIVSIIGWAENHVAKYLENPTDTQVITLTTLDRDFVNPDTHYREKITIGLNTLIRTFSELVVGVSKDSISILNMNLSDSQFSRAEMDRFVLKSLVPKIFVPIAPLFMNQFDISNYCPRNSRFANRLVALGHDLKTTGLFPPGFKLSQVIQRQSHRDIVDIVVNGRTGVSYGFIAYIEPPTYVGELAITEAEWLVLHPVDGLNPLEVRQNEAGRRYIRLGGEAGDVFKQIPDIWLVSSRSGANKTDLDCDRDILRIGLKQGLLLQLPTDIAPNTIDVKPSYDIYVMVAIALSTALYTPDLVRYGAPIVHFHGYPSVDWFEAGEHYVGVDNPSVPCGTYESGVFNFLGISQLAAQKPDEVSLVALIEPDHGTNIIASDPQSLVERLNQGCQRGQIELGGKHFASLRSVSTAKAENTPAAAISG